MYLFTCTYLNIYFLLLAPIFTTNEKDNSLTRNDPNILGDYANTSTTDTKSAEI